MENAARSGTQVQMRPKRCEVRMPVALSVRVLGIDENGKAFHQAALTMDISMSGARVTGLMARPQQGDIVGLQSGGAKCRFKVVWIGANPDSTFQLGLQCLEKGASPWRETLKQARGDDRRGEDRYPCNGSASVHSAALSTPIWGTLRDIGQGGCYVQCVNPPVKGEIVSGQFTLNGVQINAVAEVRTSRATVGMGLQWCDLGWDGEERLRNLLSSFSLHYSETNSSKAKAMAQLEKLHQLVSALRERLENRQTMVDVQMIGRLSDALEKLSEALKSVQS